MNIWNSKLDKIPIQNHFYRHKSLTLHLTGILKINNRLLNNWKCMAHFYLKIYIK